MLEINVDQYVAENSDRLAKLGYNAEEIAAIARFEVFLEVKKSEVAGQAILDHINTLLPKLNLTFDKWDGGNLYASDKLGRRYVVPGDWWGAKYVLRGVVRSKTRNGRLCWLCNGQASTGSVQVAFYGEENMLDFPELHGINEGYTAALESCAHRRAIANGKIYNQNGYLVKERLPSGEWREVDPAQRRI